MNIELHEITVRELVADYADTARPSARTTSRRRSGERG